MYIIIILNVHFLGLLVCDGAVQGSEIKLLLDSNVMLMLILAGNVIIYFF